MALKQSGTQLKGQFKHGLPQSNIANQFVIVAATVHSQRAPNSGHEHPDNGRQANVLPVGRECNRPMCKSSH